VIVILEYLFYTGGMITSIEPKTGTLDDFYNRISRSLGDASQWQHAPLQGCSAKSVPESLILLVGPRSLNTTMLNAIARLGEGGPVRVLDGGNRFNAYIVARAVRGMQEVLNRITISRAFTCYQVLAMFENMTSALPIPFVVLDLLNTFYDEAVQIGERKRLLKACTLHMERLARNAGGVLTVHPPRVLSPESVELLEMLQGPNVESHSIQTAAPVPEPMRLF
jgi:hypothetical protein